MIEIKMTFCSECKHSQHGRPTKDCCKRLDKLLDGDKVWYNGMQNGRTVGCAMGEC